MGLGVQEQEGNIVKEPDQSPPLNKTSLLMQSAAGHWPRYYAMVLSAGQAPLSTPGHLKWSLSISPSSEHPLRSLEKLQRKGYKDPHSGTLSCSSSMHSTISVLENFCKTPRCTLSGLPSFRRSDTPQLRTPLSARKQPHISTSRQGDPQRSWTLCLW